MFPITYPPDLPITARREEILAALRGSQVVVVAGETGSGKTTQLPKLCLEAGLGERGRIGCTQPRRVAALSVSRRVAEELGVTWGREVGCKIRFQDDTSRETRLKFMTDGILLAEVQSDPMLRGYSCLILDEAHERSLNIDFLLGHLVGLLKRRPDLKLVVTSATIDTEAFSQAFGGAPVVEVSGRLFPVEVRYAPTSEAAEEDEDDPDHVSAAVRAAEDLLIEFDDGDVLVFLPTERDIREAVDALDGRLGSGFEVLGLFGRMPAGEQTRIFTPGPRRRVIVATNIAETSLTLPRIACVVDAGLARMSRYQPRTRTKRLPVEPISQSSANQRAGRAGRVRAGTCVRLYSEEDFNKRPRFTQPEIQRANLAEVILRMKASRLGDIETFPFLSPPSASAIRAGYALLHELGALDETHALTPLGVELARLPIDPTLGRMLLQARREGVLGEMLVIAAGLSVPDPRERPAEQREAAAAAHRAFADPSSDFLSLLRLWRAAPAPEARGWGTALRRFCKGKFLSLIRMREWRDLHGQLADAMGARGAGESALREPADAIHRSVLAGLLGQVALREKTNLYRASGNRMLTVFPGSNLFERRDKPKPGRKGGGDEAEEEKKAPTRQPPWIVAGEIVETSQLWARTVGGIDPEWVVELGAHLCEFRYVEPHWSAKAGRVLVTERVLLHGLEVSRRFVDHGRINAAEATELFIRGALVGEEARLPHRFFTENAKLVAKLEEGLVRVRSRWAHSLEEMLYRFYAARIKDVSSVPDLNRLVRERITREPNFLVATEADLIGDNDAGFDAELFPAQAAISNLVLPLSYAYAPGEDRDGVTVRVPLPAAEHLTSGQVQWLVPGMREEQITTLLRALPKTLRNALRPHRPDAAAIAREFDPGRGEFLPALAAFLSKKFGVPVRAEDWPANALPAHLRPRVEVVDAKQRTVIAGRDLAAVRAEAAQKDVRTGAWDAAVKRWERRGVRAWDFGDLPDEITVEEIGGAPVLAFPGLERSGEGVDVLLFRRREEADAGSPEAVRRLGELALARDLDRAAKDFTALGKPAGPNAKPDFRAALAQVGTKLQGPAAAPAAFSTETFQGSGRQHLVNALLTLSPLRPLTAARFQAMVEAARRGVTAATWQTVERAKQVLAQRAAVLAQPKRYPGLETDVARLVPPDFLARTPADRLPHLGRYLRAIQVRAERAALHAAKDAEKAKPLAEFKDWEARVPPANRDSFRWLLEEFRVSLFAPELGTAQPASAARLRALMG